MKDLGTVRYDVSGAIATITMNRPEVANALNSVMIDDIDAAFDLAESDDDVRVVILAGEGQHFCSGHDLKAVVGEVELDDWRRMRDTSEGRFHHEYVMYYTRCRRIYDFPKPTIAAVQGSAVIAGFVLACMCDLIVAADDAIFWSPALRMTGVGAELLVEPWELGIRKAKEFMLTGAKLGAVEAERLGLVNRVVPRDELEAGARELADQIALVNPLTARMVKDSLNHAWDLMGKSNSWKYHFMAHQWMHSTETSLSAFEERKKLGSMKELFAQRDRGATLSPLDRPDDGETE